MDRALAWLWQWNMVTHQWGEIKMNYLLAMTNFFKFRFFS